MRPARKMPSEDHPADLLNGEHKKSSSDEYYRFKLREEKLDRILELNQAGAARFLDAAEEDALRAVS
jgi:hypothetical protein